jgi:glycosyltransferase 2 family protein
MRSYVRNGLVAALAIGLFAWFLRHANLEDVWLQIRRASVAWLLFSLVAVWINMAIRSWRWRALLAPVGKTHFWNLFRATVLGFTASFLLPARAGEVLRPWVLARREGLNATAVFATILFERLIDLMTVLLFFGVFLLFVPAASLPADPAVMRTVKGGGVATAAASVALFVGMAVMARHPERLARAALSIERVCPPRFAHGAANLVRRLAEGFGIVHDIRRLLIALAWSIPLWLSIAAGIWGVSQAFHISVSFLGSFLLIAFLTVGVAVPTPGSVGGFHEAFRYGATTFFGASNDAAVGAAIVLHAVTFVPTTLVGIVFAAQDGLNFAGAGRLASRAATDGDSGEVPVLRSSGR